MFGTLLLFPFQSLFEMSTYGKNLLVSGSQCSHDGWTWNNSNITKKWRKKCPQYFAVVDKLFQLFQVQCLFLYSTELSVDGEKKMYSTAPDKVMDESLILIHSAINPYRYIKEILWYWTVKALFISHLNRLLWHENILLLLFHCLQQP